MEEQAEYKTDNQYAAIIESPRMVKTLSEDGVVYSKAWGWVKTSAKFIAHIKKLRGAKLAIWMTIALSIDEDGTCKLTIKELCEVTGYSHTEVIDSLKEMSAWGYLGINKDQRGNIYTPEFVARGENKPSETLVKKLDSTPAYQVESSPAEENADSSINRVKRVNTEIKGIEASIMQGRPTTQEDIDPAKVQHDTLAAFEVAFKLDPGNIAWFNTKPEWGRLRRKLVDKYQLDPDYFKKYHKWYTEEGKFAGGMNVQQMRRDPDGFVLALNIFESATIGEKTQKTGRRMERLDR